MVFSGLNKPILFGFAWLGAIEILEKECNVPKREFERREDSRRN